MESYIYKVRDFSLEQEDLLLGETLFHNANGYLGVRSNFEEDYPEGYQSIRGQYVNGFYDIAPMPQAEKLCGLIEEKQTILNVADTQGIRMVVDGEEFSLFTGKVLQKNRILNMKAGVTIREIVWESPEGKQIELIIKRMASFSILPLFLIEYQVTPLNFTGTLQLISSHNGDVRNYFDPSDPRVAGEARQYMTLEEIIKEEEGSYIVSRTANSDLKLCSGVQHRISCAYEGAHIVDEHTVTKIFHCKGEAGKPITLLKYTVICDSLRYPSPAVKAVHIMNEILLKPVAEIYREQKEYLQKYWQRCGIEIFGDDEVNQAVRYNLYQLIQSAGKDAMSNIAAKGLSGEGYEGHYFWDTEMYIQPFFTITMPEISKKLIEYRYTILELAKENARALGHKKGALYPWRTIMGKECSGYYPSGTAQYHISGDIAYSVIAYYLATNDISLILDYGAEIVFETARLWIDTGTYVKEAFCIHEVTGPDEYTCMVNNNYYTNALAKYNLEWAVRFYELLQGKEVFQELCAKIHLSPDEIKAFDRAADSMYLPYDVELGINPQDDSFLQKKKWDLSSIKETEKPLLLHYHPLHLYRHQICKQADTVLAHFILEDMQDMVTIRKSFEYYETVTTHDSSLSTCIFSIVASKLGLKEKAFAYFGESAKLDLFNTHRNTKDGIHTANMGGTYMAVVYGFSGLRIKETGLSLFPELPDAWEGYRYRFTYCNTRLEVEVQKEFCRLRLVDGGSVWVKVYENLYLLETELFIERG